MGIGPGQQMEKPGFFPQTDFVFKILKSEFIY
jgi:hypothetical protein